MHFADVHVMSFRISAYAQYQVTLNHQKKSANVSMAADRIKYHAMRRLANQLYDPPVETPPAPSPSRSGPRPIMDLAMPGGMSIIRSLFHPPDRKSALKVLRNAYICSRRTSPNVHEMSFRIKYLCAVAIKPSSNHQKKLANVSIAAYFLLGLAIAPDMWAYRKLGIGPPGGVSQRVGFETPHEGRRIGPSGVAEVYLKTACKIRLFCAWR